MKKTILKIILIIIALVIMISVVNFLIIILKQKSEVSRQKYEISKLSDYYKKIAEERCKRETYYSECCLSGLRVMAKDNYLLTDKNENCPGEFKKNMLLCEDTLVWCEPWK